MNKNSYAILPLDLIYNGQYKSMSVNDIILLTLMLNRYTISLENREYFSDENGVFIYYKIEQIQKDLRCSYSKAIKIVTELENMGFIKRNRQFLCKPTKIYVLKTFDITQKQKAKYNTSKNISKVRHDLSFDAEKAQKLAEDSIPDFWTHKNRR